MIDTSKKWRFEIFGQRELRHPFFRGFNLIIKYVIFQRKLGKIRKMCTENEITSNPSTNIGQMDGFNPWKLPLTKLTATDFISLEGGCINNIKEKKQFEGLPLEADSVRSHWARSNSKPWNLSKELLIN